MIDEYIAQDGYAALAKVLTKNDPGGRHQRNEEIGGFAVVGAADSPPA